VFTAAFITKGAVYLSQSALDNQVENTAEGESCECWWPVWANRRAFDQTRPIFSPGRESAVEEWSAGAKHFRIAAGEPTTATLKVFYYPRWQAFVNEVQVPVEKTPNGAISLAIPASSSDVRLVFVEPAYVKAAFIFSAAAWFFVICFAAVLSFKRLGAAPLMQI